MCVSAWLCQVLVEARRIFSRGVQSLSGGTWDPVPRAETEPGPALESAVSATGRPGKFLSKRVHLANKQWERSHP